MLLQFRDFLPEPRPQTPNAISRAASSSAAAGREENLLEGNDANFVSPPSAADGDHDIATRSEWRHVTTVPPYTQAE